MRTDGMPYKHITLLFSLIQTIFHSLNLRLNEAFYGTLFMSCLKLCSNPTENDLLVRVYVQSVYNLTKILFLLFTEMSYIRAVFWYVIFETYSWHARENGFITAKLLAMYTVATGPFPSNIPSFSARNTKSTLSIMGFHHIYRFWFLRMNTHFPVLSAIIQIQFINVPHFLLHSLISYSENYDKYHQQNQNLRYFSGKM